MSVNVCVCVGVRPRLSACISVLHVCLSGLVDAKTHKDKKKNKSSGCEMKG